MTTAYELEIKEQCPQAEIVFDLYHVVAKYGRELATVLGHDVVQVKDDFRLRALFLDLQLIGRGHVDCDRFDALGHAFGELFEEGARRLA